MKAEGDTREPGPSAGFRLGEWEIHPSLLRIGRGGREPVRVEPKVMEVLVVLASRKGEVVSREALLEAVWGSLYVSEDLPRRAIYELRKIFEDEPRHPSYIETIPRAGYRLVATVEGLADPEGGADAGAQEVFAVRGSPGRRGWRRGAVAAMVLGVALMAALSFGFLRRAGVRPAGPRIVPLTSLPSLEYAPAVSPDGRSVAFLLATDSAVDSEVSLQVQLIDGGSPVRLTEQPADFDHPIESPTWSPDGTRIAFLRWRRKKGWEIAEVPALGGAERKRLALGRLGASGLAWSPDGQSLALGLQRRPAGPLVLHLLHLDTLTLEPLTRPPATSVGDQVPAWSPDGAAIAFFRTLAPGASEVHVIAGSGGPSRLLRALPHKISDLDWSADGRRLLLAAVDGGVHRVWSVDVATGELRWLPEVGERTRWLSVARQGERLVAARSRFELGVWRLDLRDGGLAPQPALSSTSSDEALDLAPSGERLAFASTRSGSAEIWVSDLAGRSPLRLTSFGRAATGYPRWRPDGGAIVFHADPQGQFDLWTVDPGGTAPQPLTSSPADDRVPIYSRDGRSIYFASNRTGTWQIWRMPATGGPAVQVTRRGGYAARESPDGRWLYFTRWQTDGLWRLRLAGQGSAEGLASEEARVLAGEPRSWEWGNWAVAPAGIYVVTREASNRVVLTLFAPEDGRILRRFPLSGTPVQPSLALAPSGDSLLLVQLDRIDSDLVLVEGSLAR